jgi:hypothetical protein
MLKEHRSKSFGFVGVLREEPTMEQVGDFGQKSYRWGF